MYQLSYFSRATHPFSQVELEELLETARKNNAKTGLTGMLVYHNETFLQVIEGDEDDVIELFEIIKLDPRHDRIRLVWRAEVEERGFGDWKMGFCNASFEQHKLPDGFLDFFNLDDDIKAIQGEQAHKILLAFRDTAIEQASNS